MSNIKGILAYFLLKIFSIFPIQKKIIFSSFDGKNYGDNPKALYLALRQKYGENYKYIWFMYNSNISIPGASVVKAYTIPAIFHFATSKLWVHNSRQRAWLRKRKSQFYIQTWHGNIALKKVEKDAKDNLPPLYIKQAKNDSKMADLFIAGSRWSEENYRSAFWYDGEILPSGLPRSDIFFTNSEQNNAKINALYGLTKDTNLVLYCPTFRNHGTLDAYFKNYQFLIQQLECATGEKWALFIRFHPNIQNLQREITYTEKILDGSKVTDMNELLIRSKLVITDYSSVMFDSLMLKKKTFLYVSDLEAYNEERGQYFDLTSLPFPISQTESELIDQLTDNELSEKYENLANEFLEQNKFYEQGKACETILNRLEEVL